jgi:hypothetical protein
MSKFRNTALIQEMFYRARNVDHLIGPLALGVLIELIPRGWKVIHSHSGPNSYSIQGHGYEYHFRYYHTGEIWIKDSYRNGKVVAKLKTRPQVYDFIGKRMAESV